MTWFPTNEACVRTNLAGVSFENLACLYPNIFGKVYTDFELNYDPVPLRDWMVDNPWLPIVAVTLYGVGIIYGRNRLKNKPAWDRRGTMAIWNLFLSTFSAIGFVRTLPQLIHNFTHYTVTENLCFDPESNFGSGATGFWVQMFCLSKMPELFDTFFIIIHKKNLLLLHWYHHISVLLYCWHAFVTKAPAGIIFIVMNYGVHALMYFYYFLMAVKAKPKWFNGIYITMAQISQMAVGVISTILGFVLTPKYDKECYLTKNNNTAAMIMYGSYFLLFLQFFIERYNVKAAKKPKTTKKTD